MKAPIECTCSAHLVNTTNAQLIRSMRRTSLKNAKEWRDKPDWELDVICAEWNAWKCLLRLRELKAAA